MRMQLLKRNLSNRSMDDEDSRSTISVERPVKPVAVSPPSILTFPKNGKKKVQFDESKNKRTKCAANARRVAQCWYSAEEYFSFKTAVKIAAKQVASNPTAADCSYRRVLTCAYSECIYMQKEADVCKGSILCQKDALDLARCMGKSSSRFGLESLTIQSIREDRVSRRKAMLTTLIRTQQQCKDLPFRFAAETLRQELAPLSLASRLFAAEAARALVEGS